MKSDENEITTWVERKYQDQVKDIITLFKILEELEKVSK
jgi:hypothetical protein